MRKLPILLSTLCFTAAITTTEAAVIFRNNFGNNTGSVIALNHASIGWNALRSENGGNLFTSGGTANNFIGVYGYNGMPVSATNVNAPTSLSNSVGVFALGNSSTSRLKGLIYTTQYTVDRSLYQIDSFEWYANATTGSGSTQRLAVQVESQWYVSQATTVAEGTLADFSTTAGQVSIDFSTATWTILTASVGAPFGFGEAAVLPDGDITAFGVFVDPGSVFNAGTRFDTFTINATMIPEPGSVFALMLGLGVLVIHLHSKKKEARA